MLETIKNNIQKINEELGSDDTELYIPEPITELIEYTCLIDAILQIVNPKITTQYVNGPDYGYVYFFIWKTLDKPRSVVIDTFDNDNLPTTLETIADFLEKIIKESEQI